MEKKKRAERSGYTFFSVLVTSAKMLHRNTALPNLSYYADRADCYTPRQNKVKPLMYTITSDDEYASYARFFNAFKHALGSTRRARFTLETNNLGFIREHPAIEY